MRLCQVHLSEDRSEHFAHAHAQRLPCDVSVVRGAGLRPVSLDDQPLYSSKLAGRLVSRARQEIWALRGRDAQEEADTRSYLTAFRRACCDGVLVEFGHVGVQAMEAGHRLKLPLIVHFHGYDVYARPMLERYGERYPRLFAAGHDPSLPDSASKAAALVLQEETNWMTVITPRKANAPVSLAWHHQALLWASPALFTAATQGQAR